MDLKLKELTIAIPTYNRKTRLLDILKSIEIQGFYEYYQIVIVDNCSDYNIEETLKENLSKDFLANITIHHNVYNTGMSHNIASIFSYAKTKWFWTISDDDIILPGGIKNVIDDISNYKNASFIKYTSIYGENLTDRKELRANNIKEMIDLYKNKIIDSSAFLFYSNNIFNIDKIKDRVPFAYMYSYTYAGYLLPAIKALDDGIGYVLFTNKSVVKTIPADGDHWSFYKALLGLRTLDDIPMNLDKKTKHELCMMFYECISHRHFAMECLNIKPKYFGRYVYKTCYNQIYSKRNLFDKIIMLLFYFDFYMKSNLLQTIMKLLGKPC